MDLDFDLPTSGSHIIKIIGVGGGGCNAVNNMFLQGIHGVDFVVCNTDQQVLQRSPVATRIQLGPSLTQGLGAGADPNVGRDSALESVDEIRRFLGQNTKMCFVAAGMGGGTGTGAAPVVATLAKEMGILTVGIVTQPFPFEGKWRGEIARQGVEELEQCVDTLLVINNANIMRIAPKNFKAKDAFLMADQVLGNAARGIAEIITLPGYLNVDFADVCTIMTNSGTALMGIATASGDNRATLAVEEALSSPLLDNVDIYGATGVLVNITANFENLDLEEVENIGQMVQDAVGDKARMIYGTVDNKDMGENLSVTVIATGFDPHQQQAQPARPQSQGQTLPQRPNQPSHPSTRHSGNTMDHHVALQPPRRPSRRVADQPAQPNLFGSPAPKPDYAADYGQEPHRYSEPAPEYYNEYDAPRTTQPLPPTAPQVPQAQPSTPTHSMAQPTPAVPSVAPAGPLRRPAETVSRPVEARRSPSHHFNLSRPEDLHRMESEPAYLRRNVSLDAEPLQDLSPSRSSLNLDSNGTLRIRENNPYLYDNPD
jgi:cell division protein FtsZ